LASIYQSIEILSKEKGIDPQVVLDAVKDAMLVAARKHFRTKEELAADFDERTGAIQIYSVRKVVESVTDPAVEISLEQALKINPGAEIGGEIRVAKDTDVLGRISAQTAKQVILQKVREAERDTIHSEFSGRVGELVNCVLKRSEVQDFVVDLGKTEARLPKKEQSKLESYGLGDRIRCVIRAVEKSGKGAGVIVSRASPDLVVRLFEQEVPEIYDNTVLIKGCAREAGERTKIAVWSRDRDVDSVGACVGMKGMRVQSIIRELRGEKIDIIEYSDDPVVFATHALSPAKISRVTLLSAHERHMEVIVDDSQLSLAIGKKGQNVRLAAKLLGWRIDIKSEEEKHQEVASQMAAMTIQGAPVGMLVDYGLHERTIQRLIEGGVATVEKLAALSASQLQAIPGIKAKALERVQAALDAYHAGEQISAAEGESAEATAAAPAEGGHGDLEPVAAAAESASEQGVAGESDTIESPETGAEIN
jgi:N utilization substance protein A